MAENKIILISIQKDELRELIKDVISEELNSRERDQEPASDEPLLSREETAKLYKVSFVTLRDWEKKGLIPEPIRIGSRVYFRKTDIKQDILTRKKDDSSYREVY